MKFCQRLLWTCVVASIGASADLYAATYYVSTEGRDSDTGAPDLPWATFAHAFSSMRGGDTLIIKKGIYHQPVVGHYGTGMPPGSESAYTVVKAENDGDVVVIREPSDDFEFPLEIGERYKQIEGIKFLSKMDGHSTVAYVGGDHIKILRCAFGDLATPPYSGGIGNVSNFVIGQNAHHILVEDCWAWGGGRYKFESAQPTDHIVYRRCVARHDRMNTEFPLALFSAYASSTNALENCIGIDSDQTAYYTQGGGIFYAAFFSPNSSTSSPNDGYSVLGSIALNVAADGVNVMFTVGEGHRIRDTVVWHALNGISYGPASSNAAPVIDHVTIGDIYGEPGEPADGGDGNGVMGVLTASLTNSLLSQVRNYGVYGLGLSDYNDFYGVKGPVYGGYTYRNEPKTPAGQHDLGTDPALTYITQLPGSSPLRGAARDGGDVGATVLKRYGVSGTLWGDPGWDTLTDENLWPFPNEDRIKKDMASYEGPPSGKRGFCADGNGRYGGPITLTSYIWEYLGQSCPPEVCGGSGAGGTGGTAGLDAGVSTGGAIGSGGSSGTGGTRVESGGTVGTGGTLAGTGGARTGAGGGGGQVGPGGAGGAGGTRGVGGALPGTGGGPNDANLGGGGGGGGTPDASGGATGSVDVPGGVGRDAMEPDVGAGQGGEADAVDLPLAPVDSEVVPTDGIPISDVPPYEPSDGEVTIPAADDAAISSGTDAEQIRASSRHGFYETPSCDIGRGRTREGCASLCLILFALWIGRRFSRKSVGAGPAPR
jgi:hypothetical protein